MIGKNCEIRAHASVAEGAVIGDECSIGEQTHDRAARAHLSVQAVETGAHVQRSLIWQPRGASTLFTDEGVTGHRERRHHARDGDAARDGLRDRRCSRGDKVVASRDAHPASRMIKRAMIAGIVATGVSVEDLRVATSAVTRFEVKNTGAPGGFHVKISDRDPERIQIMFFEAQRHPRHATRRARGSRSTSTARSCAARC